MSGRRFGRASALTAILLLAGALAARAQTALTPFGVTDRAARNLILAEMRSNGSTAENRDIIPVVWKGYQRIPPQTRGPATTAILAWVRTFVSSAEFTAAYAAERTARRPEGAAETLSIDDAVQKTIDGQLATLALYKAGVASLPEAERVKALAGFSAEETRIRSPENRTSIRAVLETTRTQDSANSGAAVADWAARYPSDPQMFVKQYLQAFLAATDQVDYTLPSHIVRNAGGEVLGFLSPGYTERPWQQVHAILIGKDAVQAARAAAEAWLRDLGR